MSKKQINVRVKVTQDDVREQARELIPLNLRAARAKDLQYRADMIAFAEMFLDTFGLSSVVIGRDNFQMVHVLQCENMLDAGVMCSAAE